MNLSQYYSDEKCDAMQTDTEDGLLIRPSANVKVAMKFITEKREYNKQYASLYWFRLEKQKKSLQNNLTKWANIPYIDKVLDVPKGEKCCIIGTVYLELTHKPSIFDDLNAEYNILPEPPKSSYRGNEEKITLEDFSGRIILTGDFVRSLKLVTGTVLALLGVDVDGRGFLVEDVIFPDLPPQTQLPTRISTLPRYVALVSGLEVDRPETDLLSVRMMVEFLSGGLGTKKDALLASRIVRVIVAGNSFYTVPSVSSTNDRKASIKEQVFKNDVGLKMLDHFFSQLTKSVHVDLMPGPKDPASSVLPQQPIHRAMFEESCLNQGFHSQTNPFLLKLDETELLGTSGQNLDDLAKYFESDDRSDLASRTLSWSHIAPTAPDTLACYPYTSQDPFILTSLPHIYFIGNQPHFSTRLFKDGDKVVRVVCVPKFFESNSIVLVDLNTLDCQSISFK